jgi:arylsulfatase A-like enzyme
MLALAAIVVGVTVLIAILGWFVASIYPRGRAKAVVACVLIYMLSVAGGAGYASLNPPPPRRVVFEPPVKATGPNIILIVADALRADYLKMYSNDARVDTPSLDAFARDGIRFDRWFSQASWTKPSFATIFSGRYPASHTATSQSALLPEGVTTFPEILADRGYFNKGFANSANIYSAFGFAQGFTDYVDLKPRLYFGAKYSAGRLAVYEILRHGWHLVVSRLTKKINVTDFYQPADVVTREALTWLDGDERPRDAPFMLFLHYMDTHDPFMDHARPGVGYARVRLENPDPAKFLEPMRNAYDSDIEYLDQYLGVLFDGLRQRGLYDDAVILFTADHGEEFYDHKGWWHGQTLFDELIRVPAILKLPKEEKAGAVNAGFARHIDVAPTLLQFVGATPDPAMPGKSIFAPGGGFANQDIGFVYAENDFENNVLQSIQSRECKVIHANSDNPRGHAPVEVYDLAKDPKELTNIAGQNNPCEAELDPLLEEMSAFTKGNAAEPVAASHISTEQEDQLRGLGYLGNE